tara:strand:- start:220 stop:570 length:351 start_codon:yes stop_codon:yes gene_type:complete
MSDLFWPSPCAFGIYGLYCGKKMIKKLDRKEVEELSKMLLEFTEVEEVTIDDIEIRVRGRKASLKGYHGKAIYRTNDIKAIYSHAHAKCVEAEKAVNEIRGSKGTKVLTYAERMER